MCQPCDPICKTCYDSANNTCTACLTYQNVTYLLQYGTDTCVDVCPDGQYANETAHKCLVCDSNCETCEGEPDNCTSCEMDGGAYVFL